MAACFASQYFVLLVWGDIYPLRSMGRVPLSPQAWGTGPREMALWDDLFVSPLMKCTNSNAPKLVTVWQVIKQGLSLIHSDKTMPTFSHVATSGIHFHLIRGFQAMFVHF